MKENSNNNSVWNFNILNITKENIRGYIEPADIVILLIDEPNEKECKDSYGYTERKYENKQYLFVYTVCGEDVTSLCTNKNYIVPRSCS
ncbi:MAG: hypothetical protein M3299_03355 [Thermoproteota archaeon]|nr:hypothetical protein [Thermoproteota archaeon]